MPRAAAATSLARRGRDGHHDIGVDLAALVPLGELDRVAGDQRRRARAARAGSARWCATPRGHRASRAAGARASVRNKIDQTLVEFVHAQRCPAFRRKSTRLSALGGWRPTQPTLTLEVSTQGEAAMLSVVVVGAGHIGSTIASFPRRERRLSGDGARPVVSGALAALPKHPAITGQLGDAGDHDALVGCLDGAFAVLSAAPYHQTVRIAEAARVDAKVHYLDLTEDVASTRVVRALAAGAETAFIPQCGLAPGFISIVAADLAARFDDAARRAPARRRAAEISVERPELQPDVVHRRGDQRVLRAVRSHRRRATAPHPRAGGVRELLPGWRDLRGVQHVRRSRDRCARRWRARCATSTIAPSAIPAMPRS